MSLTWKLIILGVVSLIVIAAGIEAWLKRGKSAGPLLERMDFGPYGKPQDENTDAKTPLGMEATDMRSVEEADRLNRILGSNTSMINRWRKH